MNTAQIYEKIGFYTNLSSVARFTFAEIDMAMNDAMTEYIYQEVGEDEQRDPKSFEWNQRIRDNLYPLIKVATPSVVVGTTRTGRYYTCSSSTIAFPADYNTFLYLECVISGVTDYARPTTYNTLGPLFDDSFKHPTNNKCYFLENSTGLTIWRGSSGTLSSATLTYIKQANTFSIGPETSLIAAGGTLTNAVTYYAMEVSVYSGTTYQIGDVITGSGAALTSGSVMRVSLTTACELPDSIHERLCKRAASKLLSTIADLQQSQAIEYQEKQG